MPVKNGDVVLIHYTGSLLSGEVFDTSRGGEPLRFRVGSGEVIAGFDAAVLGLEVGEFRRVRIPPEEAYGRRDESLVRTFSREDFGREQLEPGDDLELEDDEGNRYPGRIVSVTEDEVTVDLNPPLAGETLVFDVHLLDVQESSRENSPDEDEEGASTS